MGYYDTTKGYSSNPVDPNQAMYASGGGWESLIPQLIGLGGVGLGMAGQAQVMGRQNTAYDQLQALYAHLTGLANQQQGRLDQYWQQQQDAYGRQAQESEYDRWVRQAAYQQQWADTQQDRDLRNQAFAAQTGEVAQDRATRDAITQARYGLGQGLADPARVAAGAQQLYQPLSQQFQDQVLRSAATSAASKGIASGGIGSATLQEAIAPYLQQQQQQAMTNYLQSQGMALNAYQYAPSLLTPNPGQAGTVSMWQGGPYTPSPPKPTGPADYPSVPTYIPGEGSGNMSQLLQQLGGLIGGSGGGSGIVQTIAGLLRGMGGGGGNLNEFGNVESPYGSDIPGMTPGYTDVGNIDPWQGSGLTGGDIGSDWSSSGSWGDWGGSGL